MTKKIISWLLFITAFSFFLHSCVHDEIYSSSDPASKEYHSKSLWKEDEKYIKNVMQVYFENESQIKKITGIPYWDYATTVNNFDESFLMVPVVDGEKVVSVLKVPRHGNKVYFYYTNSSEDLAFFQGIVFSKNKKALKLETSSEANKIICTRQWVSIWMPDNPYEPDPNSGNGHWDIRSVIVCKQDLEQCVGIVNEFGQCEGSGNGDPGYPYPGGGTGSPEPEEAETPCEKAKTINQNPAVKSKINSLYDKSKETGTNSGEIAFMVKPDGTTSPIIPGGEHSVHLGDITGYQGYAHNHTPKGVKMFSPADIYKLFQFIVSQPAGTPVDASFGAMVAVEGNCMSGCTDGYLYFTYIMSFNGTLADAQAIRNRNYTEAEMKVLRADFEEFEQKLRPKAGYSSDNGNFMSFKGLEEVFFKALEKMGIEKDKMILQRIDKDGNVNTVTLGTDGKPKDTPCPQ